MSSHQYKPTGSNLDNVWRDDDNRYKQNFVLNAIQVVYDVTGNGSTKEQIIKYITKHIDEFIKYAGNKRSYSISVEINYAIKGLISAGCIS